MLRKLKELVYMNRYPQISASELEALREDTDEVMLLPSSNDYGWFTSFNSGESYIINAEVITLGRARYANIKYCNGPFISSNNHIIETKNKNQLRARYLYNFLSYTSKTYYVESTSYPKFEKDIFENTTLDVPEVSVQDARIKELDLLNNAIFDEKRRLSEFDSLIKSRFNEMFSNLDDYVTVQDSCEVHARIGWQALTQKEHMKTGKYMLITGTDFKDNEINYSSCVFVTKERYEMDRHIILRNDDVLITKDGTIGKVAIVHNLPGPATLNSGVFVLRPDNRFNKEYISYVFKGEPFSRFVEEVKTGVTVKHLNQANLLKFKIPVPKKKDQEHFALFLKTIDKLKFINKK